MPLAVYGILSTALAMVAVQNLSLLIALVACQALLLGVQSAWLGWHHGDPALYWAAALTLAIKGMTIPLFLRYIIRRIRVHRIVDGMFTTKASLLIAIGLTLTAYYATAALSELPALDAESMPVALGVVFLGLFLMVSRRLALTQALGLLVMENGLFLAALATTRGLPVLVDAGIFFDVLVSGMITGLLVYRINATFESIDTSALRRLRG